MGKNEKRVLRGRGYIKLIMYGLFWEWGGNG